MGSCGQCRHWRDTEDDESALHGPFVHRSDYKICGLTLFLGQEQLQPPLLATARDASGYIAALYTLPDFGCVQFEAKS